MSLLADAVRPRGKTTRVTVSDDGRYVVGPTLDSIGFAMPDRWAGVTHETALNFITVYQCVRVLSHTFAQLPLMVYNRTSDGGKKRADDNEWYYPLHVAPNPEMTAFSWRRLMMVHLATWGNHFAEKTTDRLGRPQLWPIRPDRILVGRENGRRVYDYLHPTEGTQRLRDGTVFHVQGLSNDGTTGRSPISDLRRTIRLGRTAEDFGDAVFRNGARPAVVMKHPKTLSDAAIGRLGAQMDGLRGSGNAGRTVILEEGLDFAEIGFPPEDAQFMETRLFQKRELAGAYGIPPHLIGDLERATFSNIEQQSLELIQVTMMPWLVNVEEELSLQVLGTEDDSVFAEFLVDGYLRGDAKSRNEAYAIRWQHGNLSPNEWRIKENDNPVEGGDVYYVPVNYAPVVDPAEEVVDQAADAGVDQPEITGEPEALVDDQAEDGQRATLVRVKSVSVRCPKCNRLLAETATPPYRIVCRCKGVAEAAA